MLLKWQCQKICQGEHGAWKNIVLWGEGYYLLGAMSHAIQVDKETTMEGEQSLDLVIDYGEENDDARHCTIVEGEQCLVVNLGATYASYELSLFTIVKNQAKFNSLLNLGYR
jgi:hypothetical protein